ncbi:MAG: lipocalin family protein [Tissierellia bacterium]|nr:lipocalin family protein [Tissierellia bacterium]
MGLFGNKDKNNSKAICSVELERYVGKWFEIVRFPHTFEKDMQQVTATYTLKSNGKIEVCNAGIKNGKKTQAKAIAWVPDPKCTGKLLVRFFWPFKSEYNIIKLDEENYSYAVVTSSTNQYLWILSRQPSLPESIYSSLISFLVEEGFDTSKIIRVQQNI